MHLRKQIRLLAPAAVAGALTLGTLAPAHADLNDTGYGALDAGQVAALDTYLDSRLGTDVSVDTALTKTYAGPATVDVTVAFGSKGAQPTRWALVTVVPTGEAPEGAYDVEHEVDDLTISVDDVTPSGHATTADLSDFAPNEDDVLEAILTGGVGTAGQFAVEFDASVTTSWTRDVHRTHDELEQARQVRNHDQYQAKQTYLSAEKKIRTTHEAVLDLTVDNALPQFDGDVATATEAIATAKTHRSDAVRDAEATRAAAADALVAATADVPVTAEAADRAEADSAAAAAQVPAAAAAEAAATTAAEKATAYVAKKVTRAEVMAKKTRKVTKSTTASKRWKKKVRAANRVAVAKLEAARVVQATAGTTLAARAAEHTAARTKATELATEAGVRATAADKAVEVLDAATVADEAAAVQLPLDVAAADKAHDSAVAAARKALAEVVHAAADAAVAEAVAVRDTTLETVEATYQEAIKPVPTADKDTVMTGAMDLYEVEPPVTEPSAPTNGQVLNWGYHSSPEGPVLALHLFWSAGATNGSTVTGWEAKVDDGKWTAMTNVWTLSAQDHHGLVEVPCVDACNGLDHESVVIRAMTTTGHSEESAPFAIHPGGIPG